MWKIPFSARKSDFLKHESLLASVGNKLKDLQLFLFRGAAN